MLIYLFACYPPELPPPEPAPQCSDFSPLYGWSTCEDVAECDGGDGMTYYVTTDGSAYDCPESTEECVALLCERCDLPTTWDETCALQDPESRS